MKTFYGFQLRYLLMCILIVFAVSNALDNDATSSDSVSSWKSKKKINLEKLAKEWKDEEEDDGWHEDTHEWKKKMHQKYTKPINVKDIGKMNHEELVAMSQQGSSGGGMAMTFAQLKPDICRSRDCTERLAIKWTDLLVLGGVQIHPYAVEDDQILITQEDNNVMQLKEFVLSQPEVEKWTWNSRDYYPDGRKPTKHDGGNSSEKNKKKKKKKKRRKKKRKKKIKENEL